MAEVGTLVAAPGLAFEELNAQLLSLGWSLSDEPEAPPLVPGEPEWAVYERPDADARIHYSFNPVFRLRVLQFHGADALAHFVAASQRVPVLGTPELRRLLDSAEPREVLLGLSAAGELRDRAVLPRISALREHADERIARSAERVYTALNPPILEEVVKRLVEEKAAAPGRSVVFAHLPDVEQRRQILRWFIRDHTESSPNIDEVLRSALRDTDAEVRVTAVLAAARLGAKAVLSDLLQAKMPTSPPHGADERDPRFYECLRGVVAGLLAGRPLPPEGSRERQRLEPLLRAITRPPEVHDDATLLVYALSTPVDLGAPPAQLPETVVEEDGVYRLRRSRLPLVWVSEVEHWLGEGNQIHRVRSRGFFMLRAPLGRAAAEWARAQPAGSVGEAPQDAEPVSLSTYEDAARLADALAELESADLRLPSADEWEMAARGPDGRRFPWGNGLQRGWEAAVSPWGLEKACGHVAQWTRDLDEAGARITRGGPEHPACAKRRAVAPGDARAEAAVRLVLPGVTVH